MGIIEGRGGETYTFLLCIRKTEGWLKRAVVAAVFAESMPGGPMGIDFHKGSNGSTIAAVAGFGFSQAWIYGPFLNDAGFDVAFRLMLGCTLLGGALFHAVGHSNLRWFDRKPVELAASILMAAPVVNLILVGLGLRMPWASVALGACSGIGSAALFLAWFDAYVCLPTFEATGRMLLGFVSCAVMRLIMVVLTAMLPWATYVLLVGLPFASFAMLRIAKGGAGSEINVRCSDGKAAEKPVSESAFKAERFRSFAGLHMTLIEFVAIGLLFGFLRDGVSQWNEMRWAGVSNGVAPRVMWAMVAAHLMCAVVLLAVFCWIRARSGHGGPDSLFRVTLVLSACVVLGVGFWDGMGEGTLSAIMLAARSFVSVCLYAQLFTLAERHAEGANDGGLIWGYGFCTGSYELAIVAGMALYGVVCGLLLFGTLPFEVVYAGVSLLLLLLLYTCSRSVTMGVPLMQRGGLPDGDAADSNAPSPMGTAPHAVGVPTLDLPKDVLSLLTEREATVVRLVCSGHSRSYVADELCVSPNTVNYYIKQIHRKLGVHNQRELMEYLGLE